ncbi:hypothetical protein N7517_004703 [Penicillium concentricum]|uniref:Uncharacterized protein n=1 Tax=Penicillium concentricum TaxID=293559 RepID=A0A9W9S602_9EURO|nr:uncharacterized protein N7517_004703 [Penicillium concentricum]KAJ5372697.1 hypothetical protein N7517_004703 [Penicillium concentricum]
MGLPYLSHLKLPRPRALRSSHLPLPSLTQHGLLRFVIHPDGTNPSVDVSEALVGASHDGP